jgi:hypothetical protein
MAIARVVTARCLPGKLDAFIAGLGEVKKIIEGHGARASFYRGVAGGTPNAVLIVSEVDDWAAFAEVSAKVSADPGWQAIERRLVDDPSAEILSNEIIEQFEIP